MISALFYLIRMASKITTLKPACDYTLEGIRAVSLLDWEDFVGFEFSGDDLYSNCQVVAINQGADFVDVQSDFSKYTSQVSTRVYTHTVECFVAALNASMLSNLALGIMRRYVVLFETNAGKRFVFGYEAGASFNYAGQTEGAIGATVTLTCLSRYPLFEVNAAVVSPVWILDTGFWNTAGVWLNSSVWNN